MLLTQTSAVDSDRVLPPSHSSARTSDTTGPRSSRRIAAGDEVRFPARPVRDHRSGAAAGRPRRGDAASPDADHGAAGRGQDRAPRQLDLGRPRARAGGMAVAGCRRRGAAPLLARRARGAAPRRRRRGGRGARRPPAGPSRSAHGRAGLRARGPRRAGRARARRLPRGRRGRTRRRRPAAAPAAAHAAARDRHARRPAAAARPAAPAGATRRAARARPGPDARRDCSHADSRGGPARRSGRPPPVEPHRGLGGGAAAGRAVAARPPGPDAVRQRLRRRRPCDQRLPDLGGHVAAVARRSLLPAADVDRGRAQR